MNTQSTEETPITNVSDTSFWVASYRAEESERKDALFRDPFAKRLVGERGRRISEMMPKIGQYAAWSVISRTVIIDRFIERLVNEGVDAVVNLGAGLDSRPYRMNLPANLEWIEVDQESVISHKARVLESETPRVRLTRIAADLADEGQRRAVLAAAAPTAKKVLVLTEGVLPYLRPEDVVALANELRAQRRFAFWIAEYIDPRVYPRLQSTIRTQKMKNAPFLFYPPDWYGFFRKLGWEERETRYHGEIAREFNRFPPMPVWMRWIFPLMPKKAKEGFMRMTGYVIFRRAHETH